MCSFKFCDSVFASYGRYDSLISMSCSRPLDQILLKAMCNSLGLAKSHITCAACYRRSWVTLETDVTISHIFPHSPGTQVTRSYAVVFSIGLVAYCLYIQLTL